MYGLVILGVMVRVVLFVSMFLSLLSMRQVFAQSNVGYNTVTFPNIQANHIHRMFSQTPASSSNNCQVLELDDAGVKTYKYEFEQSYSGNFSFAHSWWFPEPGAWSVVGLGPTIDHYVLFSGSISSERVKRDLYKKKLPLRKRELDKWQVGDSAFWNSEGGATLSAATGISPFYAGVSFTVKGSWANYVEKVGENKVFVSLISRRVMSISPAVGVYIVGAAFDHLRDHFKFKSYEVEIIDDEHEIAYRKFLRGNEQELINLVKSGSKSITPIEVGVSNSRSNTYAASLAVPFFPIISWRLARSKGHGSENAVADWGSEREKFSYDDNWFHTYRFFNLDFRRSYEVQLTDQLLRHSDDSSVHGQDLSLTYTYEADHGKVKRLLRQIKRFRKNTGLISSCIISKIDDRAKIGYHQVQSKLKLGKLFIDQFYNSIKEQNLKNVLLTKIDTILSDADSLSILCKKERNQPRCIGKLRKRFLRHLEKMLSNYDKLDLSSRKQKAEFIHHFVSKAKDSALVSLLMHELASECGGEVRVNVHGENIKKIEFYNKAGYSDRCL